jgi:hypothetical protein
MQRNRMPNRLAAAAILAASVAAPVAFANDTMLSTIKSVDVFARTIVVENGTSYPVVRGINLAKFKAGDKVVLETDDRKGTRTIVKLGKGDHVPILLPNQPTNRPRIP